MIPVRPVSPPSLKMIDAIAPAVRALSAFRPNVHVPRCISAIEPAGIPAKSAAWQPDVVAPAVGAGGSTRSTAQTGAVVVGMEPEEVIDEKSTPST